MQQYSDILVIFVTINVVVAYIDSEEIIKTAHLLGSS